MTSFAATSLRLQHTAFVVVLLAVLTPRAAHADEIDRCLSAHTDAQRLRQDGKLRAERDALLVCTRQICPGVVRAECAAWLVEVDGLIPTLLIAARTPIGSDIADA